MTNQSPLESSNPIPERRKRPATGVTFDEMIAIIVAFSTIGAILFWTIGGKNKLASNLGLGGGSNLFSSNQTTDTGLSFGNEELASENRRLAAKLREQDQAVAYIPPSQSATLPERIERRSFSLDSGAKLVPLAGLGVAGAGRIDSPKVVGDVPEEVVTEENKLDTNNVETETETETAKVEPTPITPETTTMPQDVVPDYWAYPFVKQMRDKALVPEIARNQEFDPDALITRASMATLVSQAFDGQPENESIKRFNDVTNQNAIAKDIDKAVRMNFMQGYSDDEFKPLQNIPRYQVLVTLATGLGLQPSQDADQILQQFSDRSNMPDWAKQQVAGAAEAGLVVNPPDVASDLLDPERPATRAEVAAMIHQALVTTGKLEPLESEYIIKP